MQIKMDIVKKFMLPKSQPEGSRLAFCMRRDFLDVWEVTSRKEILC